MQSEPVPGAGSPRNDANSPLPSAPTHAWRADSSTNTSRTQWAAGGASRADPAPTSTSHRPLELLRKLRPSWESSFATISSLGFPDYAITGGGLSETGKSDPFQDILGSVEHVVGGGSDLAVVSGALPPYPAPRCPSIRAQWRQPRCC